MKGCRTARFGSMKTAETGVGEPAFRRVGRAGGSPFFLAPGAASTYPARTMKKAPSGRPKVKLVIVLSISRTGLQCRRCLDN
jgi:hypothetical protein